MSPPVCFLERAAQGDAIERVRLTGERLEEAWTPEASMGASERARAGAQWVAQVLANHSDRALELVCLDACGSFCAWTRPTTRDARVIETVIRQSEGESLVGAAADLSSFEESAQSTEGLVGRDLAAPGGGRFQVVLDEEVSEGELSRSAVLAVRDPAASLFLDELDSLGIKVQGVDSVWHLIASAWDPAEPLRETPAQGEMIVASDAPMAAICVLDVDGKLVWSWTRKGRLIAAGQMRVPSREDVVQIRAGSIGRLSADWLAWSSQLGAAPRRIVFVGPSQLDEGGLTLRELGAALSRALPSATADLAPMDDPLGETCRRVAGYRGEAVSPSEDPARALVGLAARPSRANRNLYRWMAVGLVVLGVLAGLTASEVFDRAAQMRQSATEFRAEQSRLYQSLQPSQPASGGAIKLNLQLMVADAQQQFGGDTQIDPPRPIMRELEALMLPLSYVEGLELEYVEFGGFAGNRLVVSVEETSVYEELRITLNNMDSAINWQDPSQRNVRNRIEVNFTGAWR